MNVYAIYLEGFGGDTEYKVVDEETFNWINGPSGRPANNPVSWEDPYVPDSQQAQIIEGYGGPLEITCGSYNNDRALAAHPIGQYKYYDEREDLKKAVELNGDTLTDEFWGSIY